MTTTAGLYTGFRRSRQIGGSHNSQGLNKYRIANGFTTAIFFGDPVKMDNAAGVIVLASVSTDYVTGVFQGCYWDDPTTKRTTWSPYFPATTSSAPSPTKGTTQPIALVADDPRATWVIQANASVTVGAIGANMAVSVGTGNTLTGQSAAVLDPSRIDVRSGQAMVRVLDIFDIPGNVAGDAFTVCEVMFVQDAFTRTSVQ